MGRMCVHRASIIRGMVVGLVYGVERVGGALIFGEGV